jgi:YVTN family beta-propeller protein
MINSSYVALGLDAGSVCVIDTNGNAVAATVDVGMQPGAVAVSPDGRHAYIPNVTNSVAVYDADRNIVIGNIDVGVPAESVALNADGSRGYVTLPGKSAVAVLG